MVLFRIIVLQLLHNLERKSALSILRPQFLQALVWAVSCGELKANPIELRWNICGGR